MANNGKVSSNWGFPRNVWFHTETFDSLTICLL